MDVAGLHRRLRLAVTVLSLILVILVIVAVAVGKRQEVPASSAPEPTTTVMSAATATASTVPGTTAAPPPALPLYSRAELESLDSTVQEYGPGYTSGGKRPEYAVSDQKKYEKYGANFIAPDNSTVYLTFDCGYEYTHADEAGNKIRVTEWILDTLKEKNVQAVFFVTMDYVTKQPDLVRRMIDEGHAVGNHSTTHPNIPSLSVDRIEEEIMTLHDYVKEHFGYEMHLFRPPEGKYSMQSLAVAQNLGYKTVHWSFAYADWDPANQPSVEKGLATVTGRHHNGAIYLLHAVSVTNATILADVIDFMVEQGYELALFQ